jgi:hypothetical protein
VVEVESRDRLGRSQVVSVDLYAGGDEPMTWAKPVTRVFSVATDKSRYDPGATASMVLRLFLSMAGNSSNSITSPLRRMRL